MTPRGPARHALCTMGISSASGRSATSRTVSPARFTTQTRFGKRPQGISYENGRRSSSRMANAPSGDGSHRVCIRASPSPNGATTFVSTSTTTNSLKAKCSNRSASCASLSRSAYVRACATTPPALVCTRGPRGVGDLAGRGGLFAGTTHAAMVVGSSQE